jgi:hypothetical protein
MNYLPKKIRFMKTPKAMLTRKIETITVIVCLLFSLSGNAQNNENSQGVKRIEALPRDLEIQLALSALPPHLRDSATVYVLNPDKGFEMARKGSNGFHTFVARTGDDAMQGDWPLKEYPKDVLYPVSFDAAGAKANMQVFFDIAKMQAEGMPPEKLKKIIQDRYKTNYYKPPERPGVSYMLSPILRTYSNPDKNDSILTASIPHVMHYAPNLTDRDIGSAKPSFDNKYPFIIHHGAHGYTIQHLGEEERAAIRKEYEEMLAKLCRLNNNWCIPKSGEQGMHRHN